MKATLVLIITAVITYSSVNNYSLINRYYNSFNLNQDINDYKVYKIDSINNYYLIYARQKHDIFKIISKKEKIKKYDLITINNEYKFHLKSILSKNGHSVIPANSMFELSGWAIDKSTIIDFEGDSIRDLYKGDNIRGLYYLKSKQLKK